MTTEEPKALTQSEINHFVGARSGVDGSIYFCAHSGVTPKGKSLYCDNCSTVQKRQAMDKEENKNWQDTFGKDYPCKMECLTK